MQKFNSFIGKNPGRFIYLSPETPPAPETTTPAEDRNQLKSQVEKWKQEKIAARTRLEKAGASENALNAFELAYKPGVRDKIDKIIQSSNPKLNIKDPLSWDYIYESLYDNTSTQAIRRDRAFREGLAKKSDSKIALFVFDQLQDPQMRLKIRDIIHTLGSPDLSNPDVWIKIHDNLIFANNKGDRDAYTAAYKAVFNETPVPSVSDFFPEKKKTAPLSEEKAALEIAMKDFIIPKNTDMASIISASTPSHLLVTAEDWEKVLTERGFQKKKERLI